MQTDVAGIYAAGDVVGRPYLASTGVAQAAAAVDHMFPLGETLDITELGGNAGEEDVADGAAAYAAAFDLASNPFAFPVGVWSSPEAAYFGLTLPQASIIYNLYQC